MKTFALPVSDCGCFIAGDISVDALKPPLPDDKPYPRFGVIVWYETPEAAKAACKAVADAHWPEPAAHNSNKGQTS